MADYPQPSNTSQTIFNTLNFTEEQVSSSGGGGGSSNEYIIKTRLYQNLTYGVDDGYYGLAKDVYPLPDITTANVVVNTLTARTIPAGNYRANCWSPQLGIFVAVGNGVGATSPDGVNWTARTITTGNLWDVCWSPEVGLFVAVIGGGTITPKIFTSPDGINWTGRGSTSLNFSGVCWSKELGIFVIVGASITNNILTSPDGITWTLRDGARDLTKVIWSPELGLFVASSQLIGAYSTSPDGINWTARDTGSPSGSIDLEWSPSLGVLCIVSSSGSSIYSSKDAINWTQTFYNASVDFRNICWSPQLGIFCATGNIGGFLNFYISVDGYNWILKTPSPSITSCLGNTWCPELGIFCVVGQTNTCATSTFKGRPPTSYNSFNSPYRTITESGLLSMTLNEVKSTITEQSSLPSFKISSLLTNTLNTLLYLENDIGGGYNSSVGAGDNAIIGGSVAGNGNFTIAPYYAGYAGLRFTSAGEIQLRTGFSAGQYLPQPTPPGGVSNWTSLSDARLKKNIEPLIPSLDKICALRPVSYLMKDEDENSKRNAGLIAQETIEIFPEIVSTTKLDDNEYYGIGYTALIPYLIKTIQELNAEIVALELLLP